MSTNDRKIIRTEHVPTGQTVDFYLSKDVSPSVIKRIRQWDDLRDKADNLKGDRPQSELDDDTKTELAGIYARINDLGLQIFASLLDPKEGIPGNIKRQFGYENKFEFITDCAKSNYVISKTINFFWSSLPSSTALQGDKDYQESLKEQVQMIDPSADTNPSSTEPTP